uniref:Aminopeptidase n=1 Tax=Astatotilapia calliptera TaxID=8154 RepID=A0AAX7U8Y8_ASTCA
MIENSMFEEEPDVVDLTFPALDPDEVTYEPRSSRLLVRGLGENDMDDDEEDCESSARLLGMSFMNRSSAHRSNSSPYTRQAPPRSCSRPSSRTIVVCVLFLVIVASVTMVFYFLPGCTFTKAGCHKPNKTNPIEPVYPISTNGELFPWAQLRLPQSIKPLSYDLTLNPDLDKMTFTGRTVISMSILHSTNRIVFHGANLNITKATFKASDVTILEYKPRQQLAVNFSEELKAGQYCVLTMEYSANFSNAYDGFYKSFYIDKDRNKRVLAATQFEPLSARKAFPCFDEPAFKATFLIKISRKKTYMTLSNMPKAKSTNLSNGLVQDEFEKTSVNMSTYLVAFIVADFTPNTKNVSETQVSVYSVPEKNGHTEYALTITSKLLEFYNNFFDINYPLKKLDLVAIPDFLAGAMENLGLITFRETTLLVGKESSLLEKQVVASVIAHELAHQWFGNLVTMTWWNDLWLNEGFATYMEYMSLFKSDNVMCSYILRFRALDKDALNSSHAVSTDVNTTEQVEEMFDSVSYEKGASILLMLNASFPGDQQFRKGIIEYLKQFSGLNTDTDDLWNSLTQKLDRKKLRLLLLMMTSWTSQKGFPLVTVNLMGNQVTLAQEHFLLTSDNTTHTSSLWHIPVTYVNDSCSLAPEYTFKLSENVTWLKLNYKNTGFYIVDYGKDGWSALAQALFSNVGVLTHEDRASLIHNIFALSRLGRVSFLQVINLLKYVSADTETSPVTEALLQLNNIYRQLEKRQESNLASRMKNFIMSTFRNLTAKQTWEEEENVSKQELRSALLEMACNLNDENCTQQATSLFKKYMESNGTLRYVQSTTNISLSYSASFQAEKRKMLKGLASTQNPQRLVQILSFGLRGSLIQTQELPLVISTMCQSFAGCLFAWDFIQENWDRLIEKFPIGSFAIQAIIKSVTSQSSTQAQLNKVQAFFSGLKERGSQMRSVQEALETIKLNQRWMDRNLPTLQKWL